MLKKATKSKKLPIGSTKNKKNIELDNEINKQLTKEGWKIIRFLGKEIEKNLDLCIFKIEKIINEQKNEI